MLLALSVISHQSRRLGASSYRVFDEQGGSIGRGENNDWILDDPDSLVSSRHAIVRANKVSFLIVDMSTNGTGLNSPELLVPHGHAVPLSEGDRLFLGDFEILVQVIPQSEPTLNASAGKNASGVLLGASASGAANLLAESPAAVPSEESAPPQPAPMAAAPAVDPGQDIAPARLAEHEINPAIAAADVGAILRLVTQGVIDTLKAPALLKNQFRVALTNVRSKEKNPLKFADSADDALQALLARRTPGELGPIEAFAQAFDELGRHQSAMLAGMKAGYTVVLERFDPKNIEADCDKAGTGGIYSRLTQRQRYWDFYRALHAKITQDAEETYLQLFGEAFVRAYDDQIQRLEDALLKQSR